jgi:hypothetical protein
MGLGFDPPLELLVQALDALRRRIEFLLASADDAARVLPA